MNQFTRGENHLAIVLATVAAELLPRYAKPEDQEAAITAVFDLAKEKAIELLQERKC